MGKVQSVQQLQVFSPTYLGEWVTIARNNYCDVVKNADTGLVAEQYIVPADTRISLSRTLEIYEYRRKQNENLVQVLQVEREPPTYICQGEDYLRVKTERIPTRLSDVRCISQEEGLYVLQQALIGYRIIFSFQGPIFINDDMIGFNQNGQVRVWLNSNFAKNTPDRDLNPSHYQDNTYHGAGITTQAGMVNQIVDVIQEHVDPNQFSDFLKTFYSRGPRTFNEALQFIRQYSTSRGIRIAVGLRQVGGAATNRVSGQIVQNIVQQPVVPPQQQTLMTYTHAPSITRSLQAPLQPVVIQNFAPSTIVYEQEPRRTYITQMPATSYVETYTPQHQPQSIVYASPRLPITVPQQQTISPPIPVSQRQTFQQVQAPIVQARQYAQQAPVAVTPPSQIVSNNIIVNEVVSPSSQIITPSSQVRLAPAPTTSIVTARHRLSQPSRRVLQNETISPVPVTARKSVVQSTSPANIFPPKVAHQKSAITKVDRDSSPTIFRPTVAIRRGQISTTSLEAPKFIPRQTKPSSTVSAVPVTLTGTTKNITTQNKPAVVQPQSKVDQHIHKREELRKEVVIEKNPIEKITKALQGVRKTNSINDPILSLSPILVAGKTQQTKTQTQVVNADDVQIQNVTDLEEKIKTFRGLPHRRANVQQIRAPIVQTQSTEAQKTKTPNITVTQPNASTEPVPTVQANKPIMRPVQPQSQPNSIFTSFNYKPFHQGGKVNKTEQKSIFEIGDNIVTNISGIQPRGDLITAGSGVSTFTNPLENKAEVSEVVFTQVKSFAVNGSVNPEIRKLVAQPKNQTKVAEQSNILENIPLAQSHQVQGATKAEIRYISPIQKVGANYLPPTRTQENANVRQSTDGNVVTQKVETVQRVSSQQVSSQNQGQRAEVQVSKNDLWTSKDSVPSFGQNVTTIQEGRRVDSANVSSANQTKKENQDIGAEVRNIKKVGRVDIESMMRRHNQESKNLFEKYEQYGKNIERQLPPTSPSSLPKQGEVRSLGQAQPIRVHQLPRSQTQGAETRGYILQPTQQQQVAEEIKVQNATHNVNPPIIIQRQEVTQSRNAELAATDIGHLEFQTTYTTQKEVTEGPESRGYQYVTTYQPSSQVPTYITQDSGDRYFRREDAGESINFRQTTQSYTYEEVATSTPQPRGTAPTYEELRAALLQTNNGTNRETERYEEYRAEYHYQTTVYDGPQ